ncbi:MAG TPA: DUF58 domain-containing protein [Ruminiclostridium sp.]|nr:DUF58 domain-containing protein [Ruminiclostridium sp.]
MLQFRIQYIILILFTAGLYVFTNAYFSLILFLFFVVFPLFSFALLLLSHKKVTVDFEIPSIIKMGEAAAIRFSLKNLSIFPVSGVVLHFVCRNNLTGKVIRTKIFCPVDSKKTGSASFAVSDVSAGKITVTLNKITACDILGLFSLSKKVNREKSGLIYPDTYDVEISMKHPNDITGDGERYSQTKKGQDVNEIYALREYTPGDEIRKIHWKLSAKQNKLVVRDFGLSLSYPIFLLLEIWSDKKENSHKALNACLTTFISVSRSLIGTGICHNIAWYDSAGEKLVIKEIESMDELEAYLPELLSAHSYHKNAIALDFYEVSSYRNTPLVLLYITTQENPEKIAQRSMYQTVKTIYVTETAEDVSDSCITTILPRTIKEDIRNIRI